MDKGRFQRRSFFAAAGLASAMSLSDSTARATETGSMETQPRQALVGVVVSTHPKRGDYCTEDFGSDVEAVQRAYDDMMTKPGLPKTLILDAAARPFEFDGYLDIWQSKCRITSTGGNTIVPGKGYKGPVIQTTIRKETETGEDGLITDVAIDHIWIDGKNQCMGIRLRHLQLSTIHDLHVKSTDGPGLWLSDCVIENLFSNIVLSDNCGSSDYPAMLIEPEFIDITQEALEAKRFGNPTINSTQFSGIMIHFPTNDALRVSAGPVPIKASRRQRKMQFVGCFFHGHARQTKALVTLSDAFENSFVGTQMLIWKDEGVVMQMGEDRAQHPTGITMISHCIICSKPASNTTGIKVVKVDTDGPCLALFGNSFGSGDKRLAHAVDWGTQEGKVASWAANTVSTSKEPHVGLLPTNADVLPF